MTGITVWTKGDHALSLELGHLQKGQEWKRLVWKICISEQDTRNNSDFVSSWLVLQAALNSRGPWFNFSSIQQGYDDDIWMSGLVIQYNYQVKRHTMHKTKRTYT